MRLVCNQFQLLLQIDKVRFEYLLLRREPLRKLSECTATV